MGIVEEPVRVFVDLVGDLDWVGAEFGLADLTELPVEVDRVFGVDERVVGHELIRVRQEKQEQYTETTWKIGF